MVYDAYLTVFGPSVGLLVVGNVLSRRTRFGGRYGPWATRLARAGIAFAVTLWVPFSLTNAQAFGVGQGGLDSIRMGVVSTAGQIPFVGTLPPEVLLFFSMFLITYLFLFR